MRIWFNTKGKKGAFIKNKENDTKLPVKRNMFRKFIVVYNTGLK